MTIDEFYAQHPPEEIYAGLNADPPDPSSLPIAQLQAAVSAQRHGQVRDLANRMYMTAVGNWEGNRFIPRMNLVDANRVAVDCFDRFRFSAGSGFGALGISSYGFDRLDELDEADAALARMLLTIGHTHDRTLAERKKFAAEWPELDAARALEGDVFGAVLTPAVLIAAGYSPDSEEVGEAKQALSEALHEASDDYAHENALEGHPGASPDSEFAGAREYTQLPAEDIAAWLDEFVLESGAALLRCQGLMGRTQQEKDEEWERESSEFFSELA